MTDTFKEQLSAVITEYESARSQSKYNDASDVISHTKITELQTRCISAIERTSGSKSIYCRQVMEIGNKKDNVYNHVAEQIGVAKALLYDIQNDFLKGLEEIIHGDLFSDFLEMATHLMENEYKDAAAVMAGSTLEVHIRNLCDKHGVKTTSGHKPKKAELLNAELTKEGVYTKLDQKSVTAWLGLRNNAAHGNYSEYTREQVRLLIESVRNFITRYPA